MIEIEITTEFIKLDQFLKFAGLVQTGGQASMLIEDNQVRVNGEVTNKRGHKLTKGDKIEIQDNNEYIVI